MKGHGTVTVNHDFVAFSADDDRVVNFASMCKLVGDAQESIDALRFHQAIWKEQVPAPPRRPRRIAYRDRTNYCVRNRYVANCQIESK